MKYDHSFDPTGANEYEHAYNWYRYRSGIAADNLLIAIEKQSSSFAQTLNRYRNAYKDLREISLKTYPTA